MRHEEKLQEELERRMVAEEARRRDAELLVRDMEASEEVLIQRLRRTQEAQRLAYEDLEQAINMTPRETLVESASERNTPRLTYQVPAEGAEDRRPGRAPRSLHMYTVQPHGRAQPGRGPRAAERLVTASIAGT